MLLFVQAYYDNAPLLPPEGVVKGPCLLGSLSFLTDDFDWEGEHVKLLQTIFGVLQKPPPTTTIR